MNIGAVGVVDGPLAAKTGLEFWIRLAGERAGGLLSPVAHPTTKTLSLPQLLSWSTKSLSFESIVPLRHSDDNPQCNGRMASIDYA
jgi:hypothetical protein